MCRFLAYLTREPVAPVGLLANGALHEFIALSRENRDGWGIAWRDHEDSLRLAKAPEPAQGSTEFYWLTRAVRTDSLVMHLRWATRGLQRVSQWLDSWTIASMLEITSSVLDADRRKRFAQHLHQSLPRARSCLAHRTLDLAERFFYRVEVRRVGGQVD